MTDEDRYELLGEIGRGAGGVIYRARDRDLGRDVAFKLLRREGSTLDARVRFVAEAQIPAQLEHPNIIPIHDVGRTRDGSLFYVMKLVQGQTLKEHLNGRASRSDLLFAMLQVARGIAFAHHRGVIHRDLKPSNVMIGLFGEVLILDWGLARPTRGLSTARDEHGGTMTLDGDVLGSLGYMAPEQARGEVHRQGPPTDVHAFGGVLYELLTGRPPRHSRTLGELIPRLNELPEPAPGALGALASRCLAPEPGARPQSGAELLALLERVT
ncbi:serine/threonine protein kinase [Myxococcota bacterium]|jgi:serine/threonine protein kinase|nr:serine/threonine protein kinase [Myxococcota bacterium]